MMMETMSLDSTLSPEIVLARPEELVASRCPTVSLHLLVKNGESCVGRLLDNVGPYIHEVVAVVNDTTDGTVGVLKAKCHQYDLALEVVRVTTESHPGLYILDVPETYLAGSPLCGELYEGPFTGKPLLANWAALRNLGWSLCRSEWRLLMDADDVLVDPESIPGLCLVLEERGVELATSRYQFGTTTGGQSRSDGFRERLAVNAPHIKWYGRVHEVLKGQATTAHIEGNLRVIDKRDSQGKELRPAGRAFKVLYHEARSRDWIVPPRTLFYLAREAMATMPKLATAAIDLYLKRSTWKEECAWARSMRGEISEAAGDFEAASRWYQSALVDHPGVKTAFRLCHTRFREGQWEEAVVAYQLGVANKSFLQVLDSGAVFEDSSKILVAAALRKLGRVAEALKFCEEALLAFPSNASLRELRDGLAKDLSRGVGG
jgi:glycosyltransferase involved in cell wall biosynthesis